MSARWPQLWCHALLLCLGGCISEMVVDVQQRTIREDASLGEDSGEVEDPPGQPPDAEVALDASAPRDAAVLDAAPPPSSDAGTVYIGPSDAAQDAQVRMDAASDAGTPADAASDAGCRDAASCDAGVPPGPCAGGCVITSLVKATCSNGAPETCWTNPDGQCSMQCPEVKSCTPSDPCAADEYCYYPKSDCGAQAPGFCAKRPTSCAPVSVGVCGCDGAPYQNGCLANAAGSAIAKLGGCN